MAHQFDIKMARLALEICRYTYAAGVGDSEDAAEMAEALAYITAHSNPITKESKPGKPIPINGGRTSFACVVSYADRNVVSYMGTKTQFDIHELKESLNRLKQAKGFELFTTMREEVKADIAIVKKFRDSLKDWGKNGESALLIKTWYEWRWTIEELHKAICVQSSGAGCGIESLNFHHVDRLQPAIGILSILALTLLALRDTGRNPQARTRLAREQIDDEYIEVLSLWRHTSSRPDWTQHEFSMALGRHSGRKSSPPPGWLILWRGWEKLQLMVDGARIAKLRDQRELNQTNQRCA